MFIILLNVAKTLQILLFEVILLTTWKLYYENYIKTVCVIIDDTWNWNYISDVVINPWAGLLRIIANKSPWAVFA